MKKHVLVHLAILLLLLVSQLLFAAPVTAGTLAWSAESIPGTAGNVLGPAGVDVRDIAVAADGKTIYVVTGNSTSDNVVFKSVDAGVSWGVLEVAIQADTIAVAPDNASLVAIAREDTPAVFVTADGGSTWKSLGVPREGNYGEAAVIYDVAISASVGGIYQIAAAGREAGDIANMWHFNFGSSTPVWRETPEGSRYS